jgi:hypothetical protein
MAVETATAGSHEVDNHQLHISNIENSIKVAHMRGLTREKR